MIKDNVGYKNVCKKVCPYLKFNANEIQEDCEQKYFWNIQ